MKITAHFIILCFVTLISCSDEKGITDPTLFNHKYRGITFTDEYGNILQEDKNDWRLSHYLDPYNFIPTVVQDNNLLPQVFSISPLYPNPYYGFSVLRFSLPKTTEVEILLYDENDNFTIIIENQIQTAGTHMVFFNNISKRGVYRCQYRFGEYIGYGDIWYK